MQLNDLPYDLYQFVTKKFQISTTEEDLKQQGNINQLAQYLAEKVKVNRSGFSNAYFFEEIILRKINQFFGASFSMDDIPDKVIPKKDRKLTWKKLESEIGFKLPVLRLPSSLNTFLAIVAFLLTMGTLLFSTITVGLGILPGWIYFSALVGFILAVLLYSAIGSKKTTIKGDNMRTFIRGIFLINHKNIAKTDYIPEQAILEEKIKREVLQEFDEQQLNTHVFQ